VRQRAEQGFVEQFIAQVSNERLDKSILDRLARGDVPCDRRPSVTLSVSRSIRPAACCSPTMSAMPFGAWEPRRPTRQWATESAGPFGWRNMATLPFFTIGHSNRPVTEFVSPLKTQNVRLVVDIRTITRSRSNPQFNQDVLPAALASQQIGYER
jgi:hypothetical protein